MDIFAKASAPPSRRTSDGFGVIDFRFGKSEMPILERSGLLGQTFKAARLTAGNKLFGLHQHYEGRTLQRKWSPIILKGLGASATSAELELSISDESPAGARAFFRVLASTGLNVRVRLVIHQDRFTVYRPESF